MSSSVPFFCYGSLKQGFMRHHILQSHIESGNAGFLGYGQTVKCYPLFLRGKNLIPSLCDINGLGKMVQGEVYSVEKLVLDRLKSSLITRKESMYSIGQLDVAVTDVNKSVDNKILVHCNTFFLLPKYYSKENLSQNILIDHYGMLNSNRLDL